jgi:hypothetical protein
MDRERNLYDVESQFIREKENEILNKAKNVDCSLNLKVHEELQSLRTQKIDLLC